MDTLLKVAIITDNHPVDIIAFTNMFRAFPGIDPYVQSLEMLAKDRENWGAYDVVVYYNLSFDIDAYGGSVKTYYNEHLGKTNQGILLLHHGIMSYRRPEWDGPSGLRDRAFTYHWDQTLTYQIASPNHPIVKGLKPFTMVDESYEMLEPEPDNELVLTTEHPLSAKAVAWTRQFGRSKVFCYVSGHDQCAYNNENFREILRRGIFWCAGRI